MLFRDISKFPVGMQRNLDMLFPSSTGMRLD